MIETCLQQTASLDQTMQCIAAQTMQCIAALTSGSELQAAHKCGAQVRATCPSSAHSCAPLHSKQAICTPVRAQPKQQTVWRNSHARHIPSAHTRPGGERLIPHIQRRNLHSAPHCPTSHSLHACVHSVRACVHSVRACVHSVRACIQCVRAFSACCVPGFGL